LKNGFTKEAQANQTLLVIDSLSSGIAIRTGDKVKSLMPDDCRPKRCV